MNRRFHGDRSGVTGFFEDIPALALVIFSMVVYLSLMNTVVEKAAVRSEAADFGREINEFMRQVRSSGALTHEGVTGLFDAHKVAALSMENLTGYIQVDYEYSISIRDVSGYPMDYSNYVETSRVVDGQRFQGGRFVAIGSAAIWVSDEEVHSAVLEVAIWR